MDKSDKVKKVREEIHRAKSEGLSVNRVPQKTRDDFVELANDEFAGDYGMTLKYIFDVATRFAPQLDFLKSYILDLQDRIEELEEDNINKRTTLGGKVISEE